MTVSIVYMEDLIKACFISKFILSLFKCNIIHLEKAITACSPLFIITLAAIKTPQKLSLLGFSHEYQSSSPSNGLFKQFGLLC